MGQIKQFGGPYVVYGLKVDHAASTQNAFLLTFTILTVFIQILLQHSFFLRKMLGTRYGSVGTRFSLILGTR